MLKFVSHVKFNGKNWYYVLTYDEGTEVKIFESFSEALNHRRKFMKSLMERDDESRLFNARSEKSNN